MATDPNDPWAAFNPQPIGGAPMRQPSPIREVVAPRPKQPPAQTPAQAQLDVLKVKQAENKLKGEEGAPRNPSQVGALLDTLGNLREQARKPIAVGNVASNPYFQGVPLLGQNAANVAGSLERIKGDLIQQVRADLLAQGVNIGVRGADTEKEADRLASSIGALSQTQSYDEFLKGIDDIERYYRRALAVSEGQNPDDPAVQGRFGISTPKSLEAVRDRSSAAPPVAGGMQIEISTGSRTVPPTPEQQAAGAKVGEMVARGLPLGNIRLFMKQNGLDHLSSNVEEVVRERDRPGSDVNKWIKQNPGKAYPVSVPGYEEELSGTDLQDAQIAGSAGGAALASMADTGAIGLDTEFAGVMGAIDGTGYGDAREEYVNRKQMLASEYPMPSLAGGFLGGITSAGAMGAPAGLGGLMKQGAGYGLVHGAASSEDPSFAGRLSSGITEGAIGGIAPAALDPALRGVVAGSQSLGRMGRRMTGADPEKLADEAALSRLPGRMPDQDMGAAFDQTARQNRLGANPSGATVMDRPGQDYLGHLTQTSPQARQVADDAVAAAEKALPGQIQDDFARAIDDAAGDTDISAFLGRPVREIREDVQNLAGREFEGAVTPIYHEPVPLNDDLMEVLTGEFSGPAIRDALRQPKVTPETKAILRGLPRKLKDAEGIVGTMPTNLGPRAAEQIAAAQKQARDAILGDVGLNVEAAWRIRSAMTRKAGKMTEGEPQRIALREEAERLGENIGDMYPEWSDANGLYASRMRAVDSMDDARGTFLKDTDALARVTGRARGEREAPLPSDREFAMAGAREAATDAAGRTTTSGITTGRNMAAAGQSERTAMVFGDDAAQTIEARTGAKASNIDSLKRLRSGGTGDAGETTQRAGLHAAANISRGWPGAALVDAVRGIKDVSAEDAGRIVKMYTTPGKADELLADLTKRYGQRKARFIIGRMGAISASSHAGKSQPEEE